MTSVFNIEPDKIKVKDKNNNFKYNFLDFIDINIYIEKYYDLLNSLDTFKLKNIYNFMYLRTHKLHLKTNGKIEKLEKIDNNITCEQLNRTLTNYINSDYKLVNSIIIMNSIQLYFYPRISLS
tara:strand:- start:1079 stop:1447 length:369 start_codon:yes stop_codon:yes gene_type:complete